MCWKERRGPVRIRHERPGRHPRTDSKGIHALTLSRFRFVLLGLLAGAAFAGLAGLHLSAPGLYYDEVHQVPAAFTWLGCEPAHFCRVPIGGVATMNMRYVGALKSVLYAAFLRITGSGFTIENWRWFGIALVAVGIFIFCAAAGPRLRMMPTLVFVALMLTDVNVLMTSRHDWGPTALSLLLRLLFLAVWLRRDEITPRAAAVLGVLTGLAIFDKLSSVVLLPVLGAVLYGANRKNILAAAAGLGLGLLPLAMVNALTWFRHEGLISLAAMTDDIPKPFAQHWYGFLSLGQGAWVRKWLLGLSTSSVVAWTELVLVCLLCIAGAATRGASRRLIATYFLVGIGLWLLPRRTEAHHWILGTPYVYAATALALGRPRRKWIAALAVLLLLARMPVWTDTLGALRADRMSERFDPQHTTAAQFLARQKNTRIVAATWGIGIQVYCLAQGRTPLVWEPFYDEADVRRLPQNLSKTKASTLYLVEVPRVRSTFQDQTRAIIATVEGHQRWREVDAEPAMKNLTVVRVRKFVRSE